MVLSSCTVAIVGHTRCGGIEAAYKRATEWDPAHEIIPKDANEGSERAYSFQRDHLHLLPPEYIADDPIISWLAPLTQLARELDYGEDPKFHPAHPEPSIELLTEANVTRQVLNVVKTFPKEAPGKSGKREVWVYGWIYDLEQGRLKDLQVAERCTVYLKPKGGE